MGQVHIFRERNETGHEAVQNTNVKVAYMTKNNLGKPLKPQNTLQPNKYTVYEKNGIYQLEYLTCHRIYRVFHDFRA